MVLYFTYGTLIIRIEIVAIFWIFIITDFWLTNSEKLTLRILKKYFENLFHKNWIIFSLQ